MSPPYTQCGILAGETERRRADHAFPLQPRKLLLGQAKQRCQQLAVVLTQQRRRPPMGDVDGAEPERPPLEGMPAGHLAAQLLKEADVSQPLVLCEEVGLGDPAGLNAGVLQLPLQRGGVLLSGPVRYDRVQRCLVLLARRYGGEPAIVRQRSPPATR